MNQFSDSESLDSEDGIRFKTDSTRNKTENRRPVGRHSHSSTSDSYRHRRHRSPSPRRSHKSKRHKSQRRSRSNERDRRKKSRSQDRSPHQKRYKHYERKNVDRDRVSKSEVLSNKVVHDSSSSDESSFGPQLPKKQEHSSTISDSNNKKVDSSRDKLSPKKVESDKSEDISGPKLPQHLTKVDRNTCGPKLPPYLQKEKSNISSLPQEDNTPEDCSGAKIPSPVENPKEIIAIEDDTNKEVSDPKLPTSQRDNTLEEISYPELPSQIIKENSNEEIVGPKLPPHIQEQNKGIVDPQLPPQIQEQIVGPQLPPHLQKIKLSENNSEASNSSDSHSTNDIGPSLPSLKNCNDDEEKQCIGPTLPPHLRKQLQEATLEMNDEEGEEEDDCYGPLPPEMMATSQAHRALEERALQIKLDKLDDTGEVKTVREEWMIELPTVQAANLGLGPRQFRAKAGPDLSDRSSWTNTPEDKEKGPVQKEVDLRKEAEMMEMYKRDQEQEKIIKKHKKKKKEKSLLEQHQDKLKKNKKKEEEEGGNVRRPFDRDIDLKVNQFDDAQKKAIMKKAQLLDDRFSKGQSKFL